MSPDFFPSVFVFKTAQSTPIDFNNGTITQARMTITKTGVGSITLFMSADGGINFDTVTDGVTNTFANPGTSLVWKIEGAGVTISLIVIDRYH